MNNNTDSSHRSSRERRLLALHVRSRRQWHGRQAMSQRELAHRAGLSEAVIYRVERTYRLGHPVEVILRIALALGCSVEDLIAPALLAQIRREIEQRTRGDGKPDDG